MHNSSGREQQTMEHRSRTFNHQPEEYGRRVDFDSVTTVFSFTYRAVATSNDRPPKSRDCMMEGKLAEVTVDSSTSHRFKRSGAAKTCPSTFVPNLLLWNG